MTSVLVFFKIKCMLLLLSLEIFQGIMNISLQGKGIKALWFAEIYGLTLKELKMEHTTANDVNLTFNGNINQGNITFTLLTQS